jgi:tetratricopeptide (TPR) repeat protein
MANKGTSKKAGKRATRPDAVMEQAMRQIGSLMGDADGVTPGDLRALMASLSAPSASDGLSGEEADARARALELAFDAMEAKSEAEARKLAKLALRLDPDCVDALLAMTELDARSPREAIEGLQRAVAAGERSLGKKFIAENKGRFWLMLDTRPYMRALGQLAEVLRSQGISLDAIRIYERMLELNPNDNQGVRDPLLGLYLATGDLKGAGRLLKKYKEDGSANFEWARVTERFVSGDRDGAAAVLKTARRANPQVEQFLLRKKPLPKAMPEMYGPGSEEEAVLVISFLSGAWAENQEMSFWLFDQLAKDGVLPAPGKAASKPMRARSKQVR